MARPVSDRTVRQRRYALLLLGCSLRSPWVSRLEQSDWITFAAGLVLMVLLVGFATPAESGPFVKHGPALDDEPSSGEGQILKPVLTSSWSFERAVPPDVASRSREGVLLADSGLAPELSEPSPPDLLAANAGRVCGVTDRRLVSSPPASLPRCPLTDDPVGAWQATERRSSPYVRFS